MPTSGAYEREAVQRGRLVFMRRIATGLLVAMALLFVLARLFDERYAFLAYVAAFAEAAMIGALADWFAVTALFRHPLRLPIPHTAVIKTRKAQLGHSLGEFVQENFLAREVVAEKLHVARVGERLGKGERGHGCPFPGSGSAVRKSRVRAMMSSLIAFRVWRCA